MHYINANKTEKKLDGNYTMLQAVLEQLQETTSHKTVAVRPLTSHLKNHPNKMNKNMQDIHVREARMKS